MARIEELAPLVFLVASGVTFVVAPEWSWRLLRRFNRSTRKPESLNANLLAWRIFGSRLIAFEVLLGATAPRG